MPDTIRTLAELNAMFADTGANKVAPQDMRDLTVSTMPYAEIGSGQKAAITLTNGFVPLDFTVAGVWEFGFAVDTVNKWIAGTPCDMKVQVRLEMLFQGSNNTTFNFAVFRNPDTTPDQIVRLNTACRIFNAAQLGIAVASASIQLQAGDKLQAQVSAAGSFTLHRGALIVGRLGVA